MNQELKKTEPFFGMSARRVMNAQKAWKEGKNPKLTIRNPDPTDTSKRYLKVPAIEVWGKPRKPPILRFSDNDLSDLPDRFQRVKRAQRD